MIRNLRISVGLLSGLTRRAGLGAALIAVALALTLLAAPAAWADTPPTLTDANNPAKVTDTITLTPGTYTADPAAIVADTWYDCNTPTPTFLTQPFVCLEIAGPTNGNALPLTPSNQTTFPTNYIVVFETALSSIT